MIPLEGVVQINTYGSYRTLLQKTLSFINISSRKPQYFRYEKKNRTHYV